MVDVVPAIPAATAVEAKNDAQSKFFNNRSLSIHLVHRLCFLFGGRWRLRLTRSERKTLGNFGAKTHRERLRPPSWHWCGIVLFAVQFLYKCPMEESLIRQLDFGAFGARGTQLYHSIEPHTTESNHPDRRGRIFVERL